MSWSRQFVRKNPRYGLHSILILEEDETYQRFVVKPPSNAIVQRINWSDNPWFPEVLRNEKDSLEARDPEAYRNVWEGMCRRAVEGAVFGRELTIAELEDQDYSRGL